MMVNVRKIPEIQMCKFSVKFGKSLS